MIIKIFATAIAIAGAGVAGAGTASAVPSGSSDGYNTIAGLQGGGSRVIINKVGSGPVADCAVSSVRPVQAQRPTSGIPVTANTVHVQLAC